MSDKKSLVPPVPKNTVPIPKPYKVDKSTLVSLEKGKIPPQAVDLEEVVLGALMIDKKGLEEVSSILKTEMFYKEHHQMIYKAITNLHEKHIGVDILTVSEELKRLNWLENIGGDFYLISLTQKVSSSAHIEFHSRIIIQKYVLRYLIKISSETIEDSYNIDPDIFELMDKIEMEIANIYKKAIYTNGTETSTDAKKELQDKINAVKSGEPPGVYTGLGEFDEWCGGFQKRELITIAAATGMGKTTAILSIAAKAAFEKKIPVAFFSLEMSKTDLKNRLASRETRIPYEKIRNGKLDAYESLKVFESYDRTDASCLHIVDNTRFLEVITKKIRELVTKHGIKIAIIDYVQLIKLTKSTSDRTGDLCNITRELKALANELSIPIIMIAMLSRDVGKRPSKRPMLSDLKQSASIEEDSDMVIFLLRMAYYQKEAGIMVPPHEEGKTELIVAKGRSTGTRDFWTFLDFNNYDFRSLN